MFERLGFHSNEYIFPSGFKSTKKISSGGTETEYTCEIHDTKGPGPLFQITYGEEIVFRKTASEAWACIPTNDNNASAVDGPMVSANVWYSSDC